MSEGGLEKPDIPDLETLRGLNDWKEIHDAVKNIGEQRPFALVRMESTRSGFEDKGFWYRPGIALRLDTPNPNGNEFIKFGQDLQYQQYKITGLATFENEEEVSDFLTENEFERDSWAGYVGVYR